MKKTILLLLGMSFSIFNTSGITYENFPFSALAENYTHTPFPIDAKTALFVPKIHESVCGNFCVRHLQEHPEGCSSWSTDKNGQLKLDFFLQGRAEVYISKELLTKLGDRILMIPLRKQGANSLCDYAVCEKCKTAVLRSIEWKGVEEGPEESSKKLPVYRCHCAGRWWINIQEPANSEEKKIISQWKFCRTPAFYYGYLNWHHQTYVHFLDRYLQYIKSNPSCSCFWPQCSKKAKSINDKTYDFLKIVLNSTALNGARLKPNTFTPYLENCSHHAFLSGILVDAFLYSHYRTIFKDLEAFSKKHLPPADYELIRGKLNDQEKELRNSFFLLYQACIEKHSHPAIHFERGMILSEEGDNISALRDLQAYIAFIEKNTDGDLLNVNPHFSYGKLLNESLGYKEAVQALTKAVLKDHGNKEAYFERAISYFEIGHFQRAISDYLSSGLRSSRTCFIQEVGDINSTEFGQGIIQGILRGRRETYREFFPPALSDMRGLERGLWAAVPQPLEISRDFIYSAYSCLAYTREVLSEEERSKSIPELRECFEKWHRLSDYEKGQYCGFIIGKYGINLFMQAGSWKGMKLYRDLRRANAIMMLETASFSSKLAREVLEKSSREWKAREELLKNAHIRVDWDKQGKYVLGKPQYEIGNSIFDHPNPQELINHYVGTGIRVFNNIIGECSFKEIVDFKEDIGLWKSSVKDESHLTNRGLIHYTPSGAYITLLPPIHIK